jgi:hypothetical protein
VFAQRRGGRGELSLRSALSRRVTALTGGADDVRGKGDRVGADVVSHSDSAVVLNQRRVVRIVPAGPGSAEREEDAAAAEERLVEHLQVSGLARGGLPAHVPGERAARECFGAGEEE